MAEPKLAKCEGECCGLCCTKIENFGVVRGQAVILENVNIHIHCGELTAIIGPNGAGKSTLLKALLGEVSHTGELKYLDSKGSRSGKPLTGYVPQQLNFDRSTPTSVLDLFIASRSKMPAWIFKPMSVRKRAMESLSKVKADHLIDRRLGALSGGELQRVLLSLALDPVPNLLLLDEPSSGIDQGGLELFYNTVSELRQNYDLSIILVSHDLELVAKYADRVVLLDKTVISSGTPKQVFSEERTMKSFGVTCFMPGVGENGPGAGAGDGTISSGGAGRGGGIPSSGMSGVAGSFRQEGTGSTTAGDAVGTDSTTTGDAVGTESTMAGDVSGKADSPSGTLHTCKNCGRKHKGGGHDA